MDKEQSQADIFLRGVWKENPTFIQLLGLCPVLAVSNSVSSSLAMGLATAFVLLFSSALISLLRNLIPEQVRIASFILIIATFVTAAEYIIQSISLDIYKSLGPFVALIVVNCIILGRAEMFASKQSVWKSTLDALGTGLGFLIAILLMGIVREILGSGSLLGFRVMPENFQPWIIMILPGGGFFVLGILLLFYLQIEKISKRKKAEKQEVNNHA